MNLFEELEKEVKNGTVTEYNQTAAALAELKEKYGSEVPQVETKQGYDRAKAIASECRGIRVALENKRKEIKGPALAFGKMIDSQAKLIKEEIESIEQPFLNAYREQDEIKKQRKIAFEQKLIDIKELPNLTFGKSPEMIEEMIDDLAAVSIDKETFGHKLEDAQAWIPSILEQLSLAHAKAIEEKLEQERIEAERKELEELRALKAQQEEQERQRQLEEEQKEQARLQAERDAKLAQEAEQRAKAEMQEQLERQQREAEQAKLRAEEQAKQAELDAKRRVEEAKQAEQARIKAEQEAEEQARAEREANKRYIGNIRKQSKEDLMALGIDEDKAKEIVLAIHNGNVRNITIAY